MELHGKNIIAGETSGAGTRTFSAVNPATGAELAPAFHEATDAEVNRAVEFAAAAWGDYRHRAPEQIAAFLETCGAEIMALGDELIQRAHAETALPETRLLAERVRTVNQFNLFAQLVREGSWVDARIEHGMPGRKPGPKPDLRRMLQPLGPIAVFGASNFPFAYSVAGGDTASALAAGNPVLAKAHPAHPGACELAMRALHAAVRKCGLPAGLISMLHGNSNAVGLALVRHPLVKAVGFTGSVQGGLALCDAAAKRAEPIPVYAEMGSTNPIFVLPGALAARSTEIAQGLAQSVTLGVGQFCTNPGLVFGVAGPQFQQFCAQVGDLVKRVAPGTMLTAAMCARYRQGCEEFRGIPGVQLAAAASGAEPGQAAAALFSTDADTFLQTPALHEELFGPSTLLIACPTPAALCATAGRLRGQLTATVHGTPEDLRENAGLLDVLLQKAGRLICNGFPTGVEVCAAMQHGGPYPATSHAHFTSVGTAAVLRFARPVCYQDFPQELLPPALRDRNERGIWRLVDGQLTK
ncbi:MAG: aldehyde dehydrogenase (NADP(+)) [Planctomycetota bacterium]